MVQFITGHNYMKRHQSIVDYGYPEMLECWCRLCDDGEESSYHLLVECDRLHNKRRAIFHELELNPPFFEQMKPSALLRFLSQCKIPDFLELTRECTNPCPCRYCAGAVVPS